MGYLTSSLVTHFQAFTGGYFFYSYHFLLFLQIGSAPVFVRETAKDNGDLKNGDLKFNFLSTSDLLRIFRTPVTFCCQLNPDPVSY